MAFNQIFQGLKPSDRDWDKYSLFNEYSWRAAGQDSKYVQSKQDGLSNGHSVIKITPNGKYYTDARKANWSGDLDKNGINGVLLNNVSFSIDSNWQEMGIPKVPILGSVLEGTSNLLGGASVLAEGGELGAVYKSKKLWRKSGYLRINPEFRIVDWSGDGAPLRQALLISRYALPGIPENALNGAAVKATEIARGLAQKGLEKGGDLANAVIDKATKKLEGKVGGVDNISNSFGDVVDSIGGGVGVGLDNVLEDMHDFFTIKDAPPIVKVQLGQFFYHDSMVIENVNFSFSKELSEYGPLYVDVKLDISSQKIMNGLDDVGIGEVGRLRTKRAQVETGTATISDPESKSPSKVASGRGVTGEIAGSGGQLINYKNYRNAGAYDPNNDNAAIDNLFGPAV